MAEACGVILCYMFLLILLLHKNRYCERQTVSTMYLQYILHVQ